MKKSEYDPVTRIEPTKDKAEQYDYTRWNWVREQGPSAESSSS